MLRLQDFRCATHGIFEIMLDLNVNDGDARFDAVRSHLCPVCGESAPGVWTRAPGMNAGYVSAVEFGGRTFRQDDVEEVLDAKPASDSFWDKDSFDRDFHERVSRIANQEMHGNLPREEIAPEQVKQLESATANVHVDADLVKANQNNLVETLRRTEFKE